MRKLQDDYRRSLDYLYGLQRFGIKLGLDNIRTLLSRLGRPDRDMRIVHVAGTNGKGSVCATLAEILTGAGFRVGLYTSPHLHSFTERIRIDGRPIAEQEVARLTDDVRRFAEGIPVTFFEFTTALALHHFKQQQVDFTLLEVGMGGRLDATNAVRPGVSIITPICHDHAEYLGADLAAIAGEKAGIIKNGVPVIIGPQEPAARKVLEARARQVGAPCFRYGHDFSASESGAGFSYRGVGLELTELKTALPGAHQHGNLSLALAAVGLLRRQGAEIADGAVIEGVSRTRWPGRLEWWRGGREVLLDGAHNAGGASVLAEYLDTLQIDGVRWVLGMKRDKVAGDILKPLLARATKVYCTLAPVEQATAPDELVRLVRGRGGRAEAFEQPQEALSKALADRAGGEIVLVAGSLFLVAAAREFLMNQEMKRS